MIPIIRKQPIFQLSKWVFCVSLIGFILYIYEDSLMSYCLGVRSVQTINELADLSKKSRDLDFEFIAGCCFASWGKELSWDLKWGHELEIFYDEKYVYVIPNSAGRTAYAAKKYGVMIDRNTGLVYNRISKKWESVGYTRMTIDAIRLKLKGKPLNEVFCEMGKPVEIRFLTNGQLLLDYQTSQGCFWIYLEKGVFLKVEFMDIVRL